MNADRDALADVSADRDQLADQLREQAAAMRGLTEMGVGVDGMWPALQELLIAAADQLSSSWLVAHDRQRDERAISAIKAMPRRSGTPEWSKGGGVAQAAGYDMGLAAACDAVRAVQGGERE